MKTVNSSRITWYVIQANLENEGFLSAYCADGDGILQLVNYGTHYSLQDQCEVVKTWPADEKIENMLENAQSYLAATYHEIFEDCRHWEEVVEE